MNRPIDLVTKMFGIRPLARDLDVAPSTIAAWKNTEDGLVPSKYHILLIELSDGRLSSEDLVYGRD